MTVRVYNAGGVLKSQGQKGDKGDTGADGAGGGGGSGDISGPVSSTDNAAMLWDGTGGDAAKNSGLIVDDSVNLSGITNITLSGTVDLRDVATDGTKLDGIEALATTDQTDAEIRAAVEAATDSNVFTDADHTKLDGIETAATTDQTDAEIRTAVEAATDSNVFTDADHSKLDGIEASATADQSDAEIETAYNNQVAIVSQVDAEAGTSTTAERWTPQRVAQAIAALETGGGGGSGISTGTSFPGSPSDGDQFIRTDLANDLFIYDNGRSKWLGLPRYFNYGRAGNIAINNGMRVPGSTTGIATSVRCYPFSWNITVTGFTCRDDNAGTKVVDVRSNKPSSNTVIVQFTWSGQSYENLAVNSNATFSTDAGLSVYNDSTSVQMNDVIGWVEYRRHAT